jgi:hypothetical protein
MELAFGLFENVKVCFIVYFFFLTIIVFNNVGVVYTRVVKLNC